MSRDVGRAVKLGEKLRRKIAFSIQAVVQLGMSSPDRLARRQSLPGNV